MLIIVYIYNMSNAQNMKNFLVISNGNTSEWLNDFNSVQEYMNELEKSGTVSGVKVQVFSDMVMKNEITYNYNGEQWEK